LTEDAMLGIRLEPELARRLDWLARATGRPKSDLAREAIRRYLDSNAEEARRQSLLASRVDAEDLPSDDAGWTAQH
jgi:RHH-type rel operon transcriptional repressor/antitoxin RelB